MINVSHKTLIYISGLVWLAVGLMLLRFGLNLLRDTSQAMPLATFVAPYIGEAIGLALALLVALAAFVGYLKGVFVLGKSAKKGVERLLAFPNPTKITNLYSAKYYILLGLMVGLGISMKYIGLPNDIRGLIDVTIGIALITGALVYFRAATLTYGKENS
jgi:hypothetical protein